MGETGNRRRRALAGFTLIESLMAVLVLAILLASAAPVMGNLIKRNTLVTLHTELRTSLYLARTHAVRKGIAVTVCPRDNSGGCAQPSGDWSKGWIVFEDPDRVGRCRDSMGSGLCQGTPNRILGMRGPVAPGYVIRSNHHVSQRVRFSGTGMSYGYNGRFVFCDAGHAVDPLGLVVAATGRVRRARDADLLPCP